MWHEIHAVEKNVVQMWATISWGGVPYKIEMLWGRLHVKSEDTDKKKVYQDGINPSSPNSDQHQFSPNNIHTLSRDKVMRINKMITIEKICKIFYQILLTNS